VCEVILFDDSVRPDGRKQIVSLNQMAGPGHKYRESIEDLRPQTDSLPVPQKPPLRGLETEGSELVDTLHWVSIRQRKTPGKIKKL
jgi:hypothetical protein